MIIFKYVLQLFKRFLGLSLFKARWRRLNVHNYTEPCNFFDTNSVSVGRYTYGKLHVINFSNAENKLYVGNYCSIAPGVIFLVAGEHQINTITTYPVKSKILGAGYEASSKGDIIVSDDVWIGCNALISSGVTLGRGAVVAAGAVVTRDVPPYAVVGGNPAKIIKFRFSDDVIKALMNIDVSRLIDLVSYQNNYCFYTEIKVVSDLKRILEELD